MRILIASLALICAWVPLAQAQTATAAFEAQVEQARQAMMADPTQALAAAQQAEAAAGEDPIQRTTALWLQGEAHNRLNQPAQAAPILDEAVALAETAAAGTKLQGDVLMARARTNRFNGRYADALTNFQRAHDVFAGLGEGRSQAMALIELASIYTDAASYERALGYYETAGRIYSGDPAFDLSRLNNMGNARLRSGAFAQAEADFSQALALAEGMQSPLLRARILANIAEAQLQEGRLEEADRTATEGLRLATQGWSSALWGVRARVAFAQGDTARAVNLIRRTFAGEPLQSTTMPFRDLHRAAFQIYREAGNLELALAHLERYKQLDDEARDVSASANLALMGARFDFASQELEISRLNTAALELRTRQQALVYFGSLGFAILTLAFFVYAYMSVRRSRDKIQKVNDQLNQTNVDLEKTLKAREEFLATTSHEIRTPLNGILGMTEVMLQDQGLGAERLSRLKLVYAAGQTMRAIVDDILDAAKIENGSLVLEEEPFTPAPTLEEVGELWRHNAMSKGLGFRTDLAACPPAFIGDEQRLRQIVYNLLSNAVKFTRSGEVALSVRMSGQDMLIEVADTGPGIPDEEREAIFAPFHQVNGARTRQHGGTGLGLFICRRLARAMGGDITLASALGQGSTFTLRLPAPTPADGPQTESPTALDMLALEPNPLNRCLLEAFCAEHGQSFQAAKDLDDALKALGAVKSQMILVAASALPKPQGAAMSALMALRDAAGRGRLVVWLDDEAGIAEATARLCGADAVLTGPFDAATALGQIQDAKAA